MIRAINIGTAGRMGKCLTKNITQTEGICVVGGVERQGHPSMGKDIGELAGVGKLGIFLADNLGGSIKNCDLLIDFSVPSASLEALRTAQKYNKAVVIGTTGFSKEEMEEIKNIAKNIPCVLAPNMSVGVNKLYHLIKIAASIMGRDCDVEILETFSAQKEDAPSGTTLKFAQIICHALGRDFEKVAVYGRQGKGKRRKEEIGILSARAGNQLGDITIIFGGLGERIEIIHRGYNSDIFAQGAIRAAFWIVNQGQGLFGMEDVLGLKEML